MTSRLETLAPLLGIIAAERTADRPDDFDDVRQEALIKAWQVERDRPDASTAYITAAARRAAVDALRGRPSFGASSHRGRQDAADAAVPLVTVDEDGEERPVVEPADPAAAAALEEADLVDVRDAVRAAVRDLPEEDRALVYRRFFAGETWPEIAAGSSRGTNATRVRFEEHVAPVLRDRLEDFRNAA